jgi:hypothetical protein
MERQGQMEVEHLLRLARYRSPEVADELEQLAVNWPRRVFAPDTPLGDWSDAVVSYCRDGYPGLLAHAKNPSALPFVCGVLVELRGTPALVCLAALLPLAPTEDEFITSRLVEALNLLPMRPPRADPSAVDTAYVREFLHRRLADEPEHVRATALCALRHFGDETSLPHITAAPPMAAEEEPCRTAALRGIRKRHRVAG